jgi:hypothetical protein
MFLANKLNKGAGAPEPKDPQFNYVTMLLHGDGTNGAQNNTFLDSSTNNFTITRNGNTTQGSFSPYGSNWSNYFNGSSTLNVANNAVFTLPADFTIECWIFQTGAFQNRLIISKWPTEYYIFTQASGVIGFAWGPFNASGLFGGALLLSGSNAFALNAWTHVAVVRNSNTFTLYVNGVSISTATFSTGGTDSGSPVTIGDYGSGGFAFEGYISNARIVKGTAVYTANFTPSTTPLTAITNTSLLTCQSNRFVDNSTNNFTITRNGEVSVQRFNPFGASTAYSTSVIGGSGYFDGSGDSLTTASNTAFAFGTGDFTWESWIYLNDISSQRTIYNSNITDGFIININSGTVTVRQFGVTDLLNSAGSINPNTWNHIAVSRSGTTLSLWLNGSRSAGGTITNSTNFTQNGLLIGVNDIGAGYVVGYISNLRVVKGTAVYDPTQTTITVPTAPLTAVSGTSLLLNTTNGAIFDNAMMNDLETVGNAQISTSVVKYGTGSLYFDGTGDDLSAPNLVINSLGSGAFTIEMWVYRLGNGSGGSSAYDALLGSNVDNATSNYGVYVTRSSGVINFFSSAGLVSSSNSLSNSTWTHIAICRTSANNLQIFINGVSGYSATYTGTGTLTFPFFVASDNTSNGNSNFYGHIDDLRITKGYARYTANFTPPTAAFPNIGPV